MTDLHDLHVLHSGKSSGGRRLSLILTRNLDVLLIFLRHLRRTLFCRKSHNTRLKTGAFMPKICLAQFEAGKRPVCYGIFVKKPANFGPPEIVNKSAVFFCPKNSYQQARKSRILSFTSIRFVFSS